MTQDTAPCPGWPCPPEPAPREELPGAAQKRHIYLLRGALAAGRPAMG